VYILVYTIIADARGESVTASAPRKRITAYLALTFALSSIPYVLIIEGGMSSLMVLVLMWCPGVAALLTSLIFRRRMSEFGWRWGKTRYQIASYFIPMLYAWLGYGLVWLTGLGGLYNPHFPDEIAEALGMESMPVWLSFLVAYGVTATLVVLVGSVGALGEEIGWRGFLVPELIKTTTFTKTALISGAVWAVWHLPIILLGGYNSGTPAWYGATCFTILIVSMSFTFAWMRLKSGSLWTAVIMHAVHNAVIQSYLTPITIDTGPTRYFIDEFGAVMLPFTLLLAFYFWRRRAEVEKVQLTSPEQEERLSKWVELSRRLIHTSRTFRKLR
jgi:uncharacterized protein